MTMVAEVYGKLDDICYIAGINDLSYPLLETDDERWDRVMDIDLKVLFRIIREAMPVNGFRKSEEITNACLFLCSDEANWINGTGLSVDGGCQFANECFVKKITCYTQKGIAVCLFHIYKNKM